MRSALALALLALAAAALPVLAGGDAPETPVAEAPRPLDPREHRIGELVADAEAALLGGGARRLSELAGPKGLVVVVRNEACPVSKKYGPSLAAVERDATALGFGVVHLNVQGAAAGRTAGAAAVATFGLTAPYALDPAREVARALGVRSTTDAFVLDASRTLRYRGAVDDQYGRGYQLDAPRVPYLRRALAAVAAGRLPDAEATSAPGCVVTIDAPPSAAAAPVTWHGRVSRIVDRHCADCHRAGETAPFPLGTREDVLEHRDMVRAVVADRTMPPWFASPESGPFSSDRSLSERDRADLLAWLDAGGPAGDPRDAARPLARTEGWRIGTPDLVLASEENDVPATGVVRYRYQWIEASADADRWVKAVEVRSSSPGVVHHVLVFPRFRRGDAGAKRQAPFDGGITGYFAAAVPGEGAFVFPEGTAKKWPAGTDLYLQVHYTPNGVAARDRTTVGVVFAKEPPEREIRTRGIFDVGFRIPPGAERHAVDAAFVFPQAGRILEFMPHMHVRGTAFRYELELPGGARRTLLDVPRYDFNWQLIYRLREPVDVPKGARLVATGWFDNSAKNPANPDPTREVPFGEQTTDEMMIGYFDWLPEPAGTAR